MIGSPSAPLREMALLSSENGKFAAPTGAEEG